MVLRRWRGALAFWEGGGGGVGEEVVVAVVHFLACVLCLFRVWLRVGVVVLCFCLPGWVGGVVAGRLLACLAGWLVDCLFVLGLLLLFFASFFRGGGCSFL